MRATTFLGLSQWLATVALISGLGACSSRPAETDLGSLAVVDTPSQDGSSTDEVNFSPEDLGQASKADLEKKVFAKVSTSGSSGTGTWSGHSRALRLPASPFQKNNFWMNGVYFVRGGETWDSLSQLFYGRSDRAELLKSWNPNLNLAAGEALFYNSPSRPDDATHLKLFGEDFELRSHKIVVKKGDTLSGLAREHFGNLKAWQELVAMNSQIQSPDLIEIGWELNILPSKLDTQSFLDKLIAEAKASSGGQVADSGEVAHIDEAVDGQSNQHKVVGAAAGTVESIDEEFAEAEKTAPVIQLKQKPLDKAISYLSAIPDKAMIVAGFFLIVGLCYMALRRKKSKAGSNDSLNPFSNKAPH